MESYMALWREFEALKEEKSQLCWAWENVRHKISVCLELLRYGMPEEAELLLKELAEDME